ncbi:type VI secretion system baseplate subunit TssF [Maridesulfovibrio hydrothermalis]|uniref:Type VI secretion protein, VC_A0110 family n=1 Tax=Maridesulfovibrio hydrothermalis AM13 = DSM 14728 TaxID=1121451 RepID=L0RF22_9BACT|nr:type VI secretion system baseplate subunit TssF [Maridesulfovibrio hydrothermalis]CCO24156.1 Type VI secretion protein, VC_A0110 family [Maridesulfovibrio hydrothermalis AM13 = DSM 14728]
MIEKYYQQELAHLRELAVEFSKTHPALAPMLTGPGSDPDVERLLEGSAFMSGMINQKLDDEFPEIVHGLVQLVFPHYLRPIPSTTIIKFIPKPSLMETIKVASGVQLASIPVNDTPCTFSTTFDVDLHPLTITKVDLAQRAGTSGTLTIGLELKGMTLDEWDISKLRFHLTGDAAVASVRYKILFDCIRGLRVSSPGGSVAMLGARNLKAVGFEDEEALLPYPSQSFPGYRILQEYFILPEKFLFFDIDGLDNWKNRGDGKSFEIVLELDRLPSDLIRFNREHLCLFATPAINLFQRDAEPIILDHKRPEYQVRPSGDSGGEYQVYSVDSVVGYIQGTVEERPYKPFQMFNPQAEEMPVYTVHHRRSVVRENTDIFLSVAYSSQGKEPRLETLSMSLTCTNGTAAEKLRYGDISKPTETSPELASFENIRQPTSPVQPPLGNNLLWRLLSHLYINYLSVADVESLRAMVKLYVFTDTRDRGSVVANTKRVEALTGLEVTEDDRLVRGVVMRGREIKMSLTCDGFANSGDMYLFSSVMNRFFSGYASVNCFTRLTVEDTLNKELYQWNAMIGDRPLL